MDKIERAIEVMMNDKGYIWIEERQESLSRGWHKKEDVDYWLSQN